MAIIDIALRKRTQIAKTNRAMFLWIAAASAIVGFALVLSIFLVQKLTFTEKVIGEIDTTIATLVNNNAAIPELQSQVRVLDNNTALIAAKAQPGDQAVQAVLDALPAEANSLALGASLQNRLLAGISGLTLNSLKVDPVAGVEVSNVSAASTSSTYSDQQITFQFSVSGSQDVLRRVLERLERSIRTIDVLGLQIENQSLNIQGRAFYQLPKTVQLYDKVIRP